MSIETASGRLVIAPKPWDYGTVHLRPTDVTVECCAWCPADQWPVLKGRERYLDRICTADRMALLARYLHSKDRPPVVPPRRVR